MYLALILLHSFVRWLVAGSLIYAVYRGARGWFTKVKFSKIDDSVRHITATFAHIQLMVGYVLYFNSPFISYFRSHFSEAIKQFEFVFFGVIHISLMTVAIIVITIGSSAAKRQVADFAKFKTMTIFYIIALLIILIAIPWPFSPLASRPYMRTF
jgi:hypothetical protein